MGLVAGETALPVVRPIALTDRETTMRWAAPAAPTFVVLDPAVTTLAEFGTFVNAQP